MANKESVKHNHITRDIKPLGQCPACDNYHNRHIPNEKVEEIKSLMQKHDWYFEYSDDQREWRRGSAEKQEILAFMRKIPMNQIPELMKLVPEELKTKWILELQMVAVPDNNSHPPHEQDEAW